MRREKWTLSRALSVLAGSALRKKTLSRGLFAYLPSRPAFRLSATWGFAALQLGLLGQSRISPLLSDFFYFVPGFVASLSWFALDSPSGFTYALVPVILYTRNVICQILVRYCLTCGYIALLPTFTDLMRLKCPLAEESLERRTTPPHHGYLL